MAPDDILLSTNSGNTFTTAAEVPTGRSTRSLLLPLSGCRLRAGAGCTAPRTRAAAGSQAAAPSADWTYLGFTDATHGVALGNFGTGGHQDSRLYYTTDGGASYHYVPVGRHERTESAFPRGRRCRGGPLRPARRHGAAARTPSPTMSDFQPGDFTSASDLDWWLLGTAAVVR